MRGLSKTCIAYCLVQPNYALQVATNCNCELTEAGPLGLPEPWNLFTN